MATRAGQTVDHEGAGPWLTAGQVARLLRVDLKTIHNWVNRGYVAARRTEGRHLRLCRVEVVRFLRRSSHAVPAALGRVPPRVLIQRGLAARQRLGFVAEERADLPALVLEVAGGAYEVLVLDLDAQPMSIALELVRAVRAHAPTAGLSVIGVSKGPARRRRFLEIDGDLALSPGPGGTLGRAVRWLTGGAPSLPPDVVQPRGCQVGPGAPRGAG